jgi:hypothetical protein
MLLASKERSRVEGTAAAVVLAYLQITCMRIKVSGDDRALSKMTTSPVSRWLDTQADELLYLEFIWQRSRRRM